MGYTQMTLLAVNKDKLLDVLKATAKAFQALQAQCEQYGSSAEAELADSMRKTVARARLTYVEFLFVQALLLHKANEEKSITEINGATAEMTGANLTPLDLHPYIWLCAQKALRGDQFQEFDPEDQEKMDAAATDVSQQA